MPELHQIKDYKIEFFKSGILKDTRSRTVLITKHSFAWSPKVEYGRGIVFTVFLNCFFLDEKFLEVSQQFWLYDIFNDNDSFKILEQCAYINYDSTIRVLEIKFDWFQSAHDFSPLNEDLLKHDLGVMLKNMP
jgi:hypothetical protein